MLGSAYVCEAYDDVQMHVSQQNVQYFDFTASHKAVTVKVQQQSQDLDKNCANAAWRLFYYLRS